MDENDQPSGEANIDPVTSDSCPQKIWGLQTWILFPNLQLGPSLKGLVQ